MTDILPGDVVISSAGDNKGLLLPNTLVKSEEIVPIQLVNDTDDTIVLQCGHILGYAVECDGDLSDQKEPFTSTECKHLTFPDHLEGCFTEIKHSINTGEEKPVKHPMRRTPLGFEGEEEENLKLMLDIGIITESTSDWASAPVLVRKRDGTVRYCVDFRSLNTKTVKDLFPLPSISQCLDQLSGNMYFSTLDMASGYWQIEIDEKDCHKTAFITKYGLFEHKRMAFGLCNAPATFQRVIQFVLRGLTWSKMFYLLGRCHCPRERLCRSSCQPQIDIWKVQKVQLKIETEKVQLVPHGNYFFRSSSECQGSGCES